MGSLLSAHAQDFEARFRSRLNPSIGKLEPFDSCYMRRPHWFWSGLINGLQRKFLPMEASANFQALLFSSANKQVQNHPYYGYQADLRVGFILEYGTP